MPFDGNELDFWPGPSWNYKPPSILSQITYTLKQMLLGLLAIVMAIVLPALIACSLIGGLG